MKLEERRAELNLLHEDFTAAAMGAGRVVLLEGAVGCGKSALLDKFAEQAAHAGHVVLRATGTRAERELPLGVLRQLVETAVAAGLPELPLPEGGQHRAKEVREFCAALREAVDERLIVYCVDDLHLADEVSLRYLECLVRQSNSARTLLVYTSTAHHAPLDAVRSEFGTEVLRHPGFRRLRLGPLSPAAVGRLVLAAPVTAASAPAEVYAITGGNPLLLRALLEEARFSAPQSGGSVLSTVPGGLFAQALNVCLGRIGEPAGRLTAALAVLGRYATIERAGRMLGLSEMDAYNAARALDGAGLLNEGGLRGQAARGAVLERLDSTELAELHHAAADVLHTDCEPIEPVGRHLVAAASGPRWSAEPWAADVLRDHAEEMLARDEGQQAVSAFALACSAASDPQQRADIEARLASVTWRFNPAEAERQLAAPLQALRTGSGAGWQPEALAELLLEQGRIVEALEVRRLGGLDGSEDTTDPVRTDSWAPSGVVLPLGRHGGPAGGQDGAAGGEQRSTVFDGAFWALPEPGDAPSGDAAEKLMNTTVLTGSSLRPLIRTLRGIAASTEPERAVPWCAKFQAASTERGAPGWSAMFATVHAELLLHLGDLRGAEQQALAAVEMLPERWGSTFALAPTAALVRVRTAMGKHAAAARLLDQPVAEELLHSVHGLQYLRARALHALASSQLHAALEDFRQISRLVKPLGLDRPMLVPWRSEASEALVKLGETQNAERLLSAQLALPDAHRPWVRGITLRARAALVEPRRRVALMEKSIEELRRSGDRIELARALATLGQTLQDLGEGNRASAMTRRAWNLAHACGAEALRESIMPGLASHTRPRSSPLTRDVDVHTKLSDSERRVAGLAVHGYTNREISLKLYVTVSTVEQHLTRVYRKLNISRRQDLPIDLQLNAMEVA